MTINLNHLIRLFNMWLNIAGCIHIAHIALETQEGREEKHTNNHGLPKPRFPDVAHKNVLRVLTLEELLES